MFTPRLTTAWLLSLILLISVLPLLATDVVPEYTIYMWDKKGDFLIKGLHCPHASQCYWYRNVRGVQTRVSNSTTLSLTAQNSEYDEYYLLNDQNRSIVEYALVVPNANPGAPFESNFLSLFGCQTGISNDVKFWYTININERAIDTGQDCDLRWNGLPHCAFRDRWCSYNGSDLMMVKFSVRCHLNRSQMSSEQKDIPISSIPIMISLVDNLPLCPSENTTRITYENITISSTINTSTLVLVVLTNVTQSAPTASAKTTSVTSMISSISSAASVMYQTVTSASTATPVHHMPSSTATINATQETSTSSPSTTTSDTEQRTNIIIGATTPVTILFLLLLLLPIIINKVYNYSRRRADQGRSNSESITENNVRSQPRWKQEISDNRVDMAESLTTVITSILWYLRDSLLSFEYNEIDSITNKMTKVYALLDAICSREDDKLAIKFCDALERANHPRWTYLRDYCNANGTENYDV